MSTNSVILLKRWCSKLVWRESLLLSAWLTPRFWQRLSLRILTISSILVKFQISCLPKTRIRLTMIYVESLLTQEKWKPSINANNYLLIALESTSTLRFACHLLVMRWESVVVCSLPSLTAVLWTGSADGQPMLYCMCHAHSLKNLNCLTTKWEKISHKCACKFTLLLKKHLINSMMSCVVEFTQLLNLTLIWSACT